MIEHRNDNILDVTDLAALVNPVNCVGVMGKGLALQFANKYPEIVSQYQHACRIKALTTEKVFISLLSGTDYPHYIINLATKYHWRNPSKLEWVKSGLQNLYIQLSRYEIPSVGIPALGVGLGGLPWNDVKGLIEHYAQLNPDIHTVIYLPR